MTALPAWVITAALIPFAILLRDVRAQSCGGDLVAMEEEKFLTSPNFDAYGYGNNLNCHWIIQVGVENSSATIVAQVTYMDTEECCDFLEFSENGNNVERYSGDSSRPTFQTTTSRLDVHFTTDGSVTQRGFRLSYKAISPCGNGEYLTYDSGVLLSPNFPGNYPNDQVCTWRIKPRDGHQVLFQFNYFNTEYNFDILTIYEGSSDHGTVMASLSGEYPPKGIFKTDDEDTIYVRFESDLTRTAGGFNMSYWASECSIPVRPHFGAYFDYSGVSAGSSVFYTCNSGYNLIGQANATCLTSGWSSSEPVCQAKDCGALPELANGTASGSCTTFGCTYSFSCAVGYNMNGPSYRRCTEDGTWTGSDTTCEVVHCSELQQPSFGKMIGSGTAYSTVLQFTCQYGFQQGSASRTCRADGWWSGQYVICSDPVQCSFDAGLCDYQDDPTAYRPWSRTYYSTPTSGTGPSSAYGANGYYRYYLYMEASSMGLGDAARLISTEFQPEGCQQLQFYYHMYGVDIDTLNVYLETRKFETTTQLLWTLSGNQGNSWRPATVDIPVEGYHKVIFEAIRGNGDRGDIAIDEITLIPGNNCTVPTTLPPPTTTLATTPEPTTTMPPTTTTSTTTLPPTTVNPPTTVIASSACRVDRHLAADSVDVLSSPEYPQKYHPNEDCWYVLTTDPGYGVQITFLNFHLQDPLPPVNGTTSGVCADYVELHVPLGAQPSEQFCGTSIPAGSKISGPVDTSLALHFVTDATDEGNGFSALIQSLPADLLSTTLALAN